MSWLLDPATRVLTTALDGYARREEAIGANIANVDTPGYKPASVDFESELQAALGGGTAGAAAMNPPTYGPSATLGPAQSAESHLAGLESATTAPGSIGVQAMSPMFQSRVDGNGVDVDAQMTSLAETQLKYAAVARMLGGKLQQLKDVVAR